MKVYRIKQGTEGKLITQIPNKNINTKDWTTTKDLFFDHPVLDAIGYSNVVLYAKPSDNVKDIMFTRLIQNGYSLFSKSGKAEDKYILAIRTNNVEVLA